MLSRIDINFLKKSLPGLPDPFLHLRVKTVVVNNYEAENESSKLILKILYCYCTLIFINTILLYFNGSCVDNYMRFGTSLVNTIIVLARKSFHETALAVMKHIQIMYVIVYSRNKSNITYLLVFISTVSCCHSPVWRYQRATTNRDDVEM